MANRREFIQAGIALSAVGLTGAAARPVLAGGLAAPKLELFLFDDRFPEAHALARTAAMQGAALRAFTGDLTELWRDELDLRWRRAPMTVGGVTTEYGLFVLETLAADRRMRLAQRAEIAGAEETLHHWVIAPRGASPAPLRT